MNPPYFDELSSTFLEKDLNNNLSLIETVLGCTADFNKIIININGTECAVLSIEGMASTQLMGELIYQPLTELSVQKISREKLHSFVAEGSLMAADRQSVDRIDKLTELLFSGFAAVLTDGFAEAVCFGIQGFEKRAVSLPETEQTISGARDSFNENAREMQNSYNANVKEMYSSQPVVQKANSDAGFFPFGFMIGFSVLIAFIAFVIVVFNAGKKSR